MRIELGSYSENFRGAALRVGTTVNPSWSISRFHSGPSMSELRAFSVSAQ